MRIVSMSTQLLEDGGRAYVLHLSILVIKGLLVLVAENFVSFR